MPKIQPKMLRPYTFHGVNLDAREGASQAYGDCPFCQRQGKFSVLVETGVWRCVVCATGNDKGGGNAYTFLSKIHELRAGQVDDKLMELRKNRGFLEVSTLLAWGVIVSPLTGDYLVPGYNPDTKLSQLYRYLKDGASGKMRLMATPELNHQIHGMPLFDPRKKTVYICEGPWDAMVLWEVLSRTKIVDGEYVQTGNIEASLLANANVLAVPGCNVFNEKWGVILADKDVVFLFDSDHPRVANDKTFIAGYDGVKRNSSILLTKSEGTPKSIAYLAWGEKGYDPELASGYDVRDYLRQGETMDERAVLIDGLLSQIQPIPDEWLGTTHGGGSPRSKTEIPIAECKDWKKLTMSWRKALNWTDGLDCALSVMLASVTSTEAVGDQLWVKVIGPAACGKSTLCEALSINKRFVLAKSTLTGFHSGFKTDRKGAEDHSMIPKLKNKTLVIKDGDTLMQADNLGKILSQARDIYDRTTRSHYGNGVAREYDALNMTFIICGTSSLRSLDSSELGERFLDCVIMEGIDPDMEDDVLWRLVNRADRNMSLKSNGDASTQHDPDLVGAMQLTGGYVEYLRVNSQELLSQVTSPESSLRKLVNLGKFVAYMRARPSKLQDETAEREFASRLVSQLTRLAKCLAVVLNKPTVDDEVMARVKKVALDTARGETLEIASHLHTMGGEGATMTSIETHGNLSGAKLRDLMRFLRRIGAAQSFSEKTKAADGKPGVLTKTKWRLTDRIHKLYTEVMR